MRPAVRKASLTAHITTSVSWIGATAAFLALSVMGLAGGGTRSPETTYLLMETVAWSVIVPLSIASLVTGVVHAAASPWGLFRHYWVIVKLLLNITATAGLLLHTQLIGRLADLAGGPSAPGPEFERAQVQIAGAAASAMVVLVLATALAVYKPKGQTGLGRRRSRTAQRSGAK